MAMLNQFAFIFLLILIVSVILGVILVNKGQQRKNFLRELRIIVILCAVALIALCTLIVTSQMLY